MDILVQITITVIAVAAVFVLVWSVYGTLLTPVRCRRDTGLYTVISVSGGGEELEQMLKGLVWLQKNGVLESQIVVADCGMDEEAGELTRLAAQKYGVISVCKVEDVEKWIVKSAQLESRS